MCDVPPVAAVSPTPLSGAIKLRLHCMHNTCTAIVLMHDTHTYRRLLCETQCYRQRGKKKFRSGNETYNLQYSSTIRCNERTKKDSDHRRWTVFGADSSDELHSKCSILCTQCPVSVSTCQFVILHR